MAISVSKPTVGGSESTWGTTINTGLDTIVDALNGTSGTVAPNLSTLTINGTDFTTEATSHYVPSGGIIMWSGAVNAIPTGWLLCDGSNSTPDLRNRFVAGAGSTYAVNDTGGADTVTLSEANLPAHTHSSGTLGGSTNSAGAHTHSGTTNTTGAHTHPYVGVTGCGGGGNCSRDGDVTTRNTSSAGAHSHTLNVNSAGDHTHTIDVNSGSTGSAGSGTAHENRPPFLALAYIMKA